MMESELLNLRQEIEFICPKVSILGSEKLHQSSLGRWEWGVGGRMWGTGWWGLALSPPSTGAPQPVTSFARLLYSRERLITKQMSQRGTFVIWFWLLQLHKLQSSLVHLKKRRTTNKLRDRSKQRCPDSHNWVFFPPFYCVPFVKCSCWYRLDTPSEPILFLFVGEVEDELLHAYSKVYTFDTPLLMVRVAVLVAVTLTVPIVLFPVSTWNFDGRILLNLLD